MATMGYKLKTEALQFCFTILTLEIEWFCFQIQTMPPKMGTHRERQTRGSEGWQQHNTTPSNDLKQLKIKNNGRKQNSSENLRLNYLGNTQAFSFKP